MISIKKHLDDWDDRRSRGRAAMEAYVGSLEALAKAAAAMAAGEGRQFREALHGILGYMRAAPDADAVRRSRSELEQALGALVEVINRRELEYKQIIRIMAEAGATMVQTGTAHGKDLRQIAGKVEAITRLDSIVDARKQLSTHVDELRSMATRVQEEGAAKARKLEAELETAREAVRSTAALAETDALTGLGNRRQAERAVEDGVMAGGHLSALMLDLDGFKAVNDTHGHAQGDNLLKAIAQHIKRCLRESDMVCRWGGDEFVVVMQGATLEVALGTAARIRSQAFGEFVLGRPGEDAKIQIGASIGAAEHRPKETGAELLERADRLMYEDKALSRQARGARVGALR